MLFLFYDVIFWNTHRWVSLFHKKPDYKETTVKQHADGSLFKFIVI
jgi:hypothetical protein